MAVRKLFKVEEQSETVKCLKCEFEISTVNATPMKRNNIINEMKQHVLTFH